MTAASLRSGGRIPTHRLRPQRSRHLRLQRPRSLQVNRCKRRPPRRCRFRQSRTKNTLQRTRQLSSLTRRIPRRFRSRRSARLQRLYRRYNSSTSNRWLRKSLLQTLHPLPLLQPWSLRRSRRSRSENRRIISNLRRGLLRCCPYRRQSFRLLRTRRHHRP